VFKRKVALLVRELAYTHVSWWREFTGPLHFFLSGRERKTGTVSVMLQSWAELMNERSIQIHLFDRFWGGEGVVLERETRPALRGFATSCHESTLLLANAPVY